MCPPLLCGQVVQDGNSSLSSAFVFLLFMGLDASYLLDKVSRGPMFPMIFIFHTFMFSLAEIILPPQRTISRIFFCIKFSENLKRTKKSKAMPKAIGKARKVLFLYLI